MAMTLRTDDELDRALTALSEATGKSTQEVIRSAVLDSYERSRHQGRVHESAQRLAGQWKDVLGRLGTV